MSEKPPFDGVKWCFWLVAFCLALQGFVVLAGMGLCWVHQWDTSVARRDCSETDKLWTLLQSMLSAALAFSASFMRK